MGREGQVGPFSKTENIPPNRKGLLFSSNPPPFDPQKEDPTKEQKERARSVKGELPRNEKGHVSTRDVAILGGTAFVSAAAGAGIETFVDKIVLASENPSHIETLGSFDNSFNSGPQLQGAPHLEQPNKGEVFDNEATSGVITPAIKKIVSKEDLQKLDSFAGLAIQKTTITTAQELIEMIPPLERKIYPGLVNLGTKFEIGKDKNTIGILYPLDFSQTSNPDVEIAYVKSFGGRSIGGDLGEDLFKGKGYSDKIEFRMKDGSRIPKGAIVNMFVATKDGGYLVNSMGGLIDLQAQNGNIYRFWIQALNGEGIGNVRDVSFDFLVPAPEFNPEFNRMPVGTYGYNVVAGQPILQLSEDADRILIVLLISHKGNIRETARSRPGLSPFVVTNLEMFVSNGEIITREKSSNNESISSKTE